MFDRKTNSHFSILRMRPTRSKLAFLSFALFLTHSLLWSTLQPVLAIDWTARDKEFLEKIQPILKAACLECHSGAEAEAGLALSNFKSTKSILKERQTWEKVIQRLELADMPPKEAAPMADPDRKKLVDWLKSALIDIDCGKTPNPGAVTLRRLNRAEYRNTIRDLLGIDYPPAAGFPGDDVGYGFDNIGDVLTLPPLLMEKYMTAAEEISRKAIIAPEPGPVFESIRKPSQLSAGSAGKANDKNFSFYSNGKLTIEEQLPWKGSYMLDLGMTGSPAAGEYPRMLVSVDGKKAKEFWVQTEDNSNPKNFVVPMRVSKGGKRTITLEFTNDKTVEAKNGKPAEDRNIAIYDLKISGQKPADPIPESQLPESHKKIVKSTPSATVSIEQAASDVLKPLASKAFRRPATAQEVMRLAELVNDVIESGESYEGGLQAGLQAILVSPSFLFKVEEPTAPIAGQFPLLTDFELATRLSYFLWSSMPDQELLVVASKKQLRDPVILKQQLERMIKHKRSSAFVENFAGQWLTLRKLDQFSPNANQFPSWNEEIRDLARRETFLFFADILREDKNIMRLLDADYSFMNNKLAKFYDIPGVAGDEFRMVSTKGHKRLGLLTHASILAVTSNPTRTSPVKRGKWVLDNLLGTPPPPAPAGVPELDKVELTGTLRQRMEQHRADPACASCHKLMDPIGLALENFDAIGRWRTLDYGQPIDTSGELPSGEKIKGPGDLIRSFSGKNADKFVRCLSEKLLVYGLGRGLEYYDRCAIDKIQAKLVKDDYKFSTLIYEIVTSDPFQRKGVRDEL